MITGQASVSILTDAAQRGNVSGSVIGMHEAPGVIDSSR